MPVLGIATPAPQPSLQPLSPSPGQHKHNGTAGSSISDVDGQRSNVSPPVNSTGRIGSLLDIRI
jgi:hypothetical protein